MTVAVVTQIAYAVQNLFDPAGAVGRLVDMGKLANYGLLGTEWSPALLFLAGEQGVWYDPSDMTTLFQDAAGTTPVTAIEQPVGLMLDKSKGLVLGSEVAVNGDFVTDTAWTKTTGWAISGGSANFSGSNDKQLTQTTLVSGKNYFYTVTATNVSGGKFCVWDSVTAAFKFFEGWTGTQTFTGIIRSGTNTLAIYASTGSFSIDNISVRELPGNHAYQTVSTKRPVLSARVNLLTKTEQFDDAAWGKSNVTVTANAIVAPDGTTTADTLLASSTAITTGITRLPNVAANSTVLVYAKRGASNFLGLSAETSVWWANFDLLNGVVGNSGGCAASISNVGNGWYRCSLTTTVSSSYVTYCPITADTTTFGWGASCAVGNSIYIWGADLRVTNTGVNLPSYQRVNTATDYDTAGFPTYLTFDGIDDSMQTNSIDFTATDKMTVFAGVRKLSDAALAILTELSADTNSNAGAFWISAPNNLNINGNYATSSGGSVVSTLQQAASSAVTLAPVTNVVSATHDIFGDLSRIRLNGAYSGTSGTGDKGTGNYGNYPLYIGAREGTSLFFNGYLYNLIVRGAQSTTAQIESTEQWVNGKTAAF